MTLPIIIVLERHWDPEPQKILTDVLPFLKSLGYDTLCYEVPCDLTEQQILDRGENLVQYGETILSQVNLGLNRWGINKDLLKVSCRELIDLISLYITTINYDGIAYLLFNHLANQQCLLTWKTARNNGIKICGVDLSADQLDRVNTLDLNKRKEQVAQLADERDLTHHQNLLKFQKEGKGVLFVVGQAHYKSLVANLSKNPGLEQIIFLHPHSNKVMDNTDMTDYKLPNLDEKIIVPNLMEQSIDKDTDREQFLSLVKSFLQNRIKVDTPVQATTTTQTSVATTNLSIDTSYLGFYVPTATSLIGQGIRNLFGFFQVPPANAQYKEVANESLQKPY